MTHHVRHILKLLKNNLSHGTICYMQQSIPFLVAILYIMVQKFKFSFIICSCKSKENIIFRHNYFKTKHKQSNWLSSFTIEYISPFIRNRYSIPIAINTHIDCSNNSKCSVRCIFKAAGRGLESVTLSIFC